MPQDSSAYPGKPQVSELHATRFVTLYDLTYEDGSHYYEASRHSAKDLLALKGADERKALLPDAVSACLVLRFPDGEPHMLLNYEYRYPTGQYVLGIPSGLIDEADLAAKDPLANAMRREIAEETGIHLGDQDRIWVVNPLLFCSPGLTDESTALLCAVAHLKDAACLSHAGAEGSERFGSFELFTKDEACGLLAAGKDPNGNPYPLVAWAALAYFATGMWEQALEA